MRVPLSLLTQANISSIPLLPSKMSPEVDMASITLYDSIMLAKGCPCN